MSWLFSQALVEEYSEENSLDGELCAQWNVMPTPQGFWRNDKMMEFSKLSRFGPTLKLLTESHGEELLTLFLAGFPVRISALQEKERESQAQEAGSGESSPGLLAKYDPATHSLKTAQYSLLEDSMCCSPILPKSGSMRNGCVYQQPNAERRILEIEFGFLPTPATIDSGSMFNKSASEGATLRPSLGAMARFNLWPTPSVCGNYNKKGASKNSGTGLSTAVKMWATPRVFMHKDSTKDRGRSNLGEQVGGQLNPTWVEWLMGWPLEWTDLKPSEMAKFQEWQQQHLIY